MFSTASNKKESICRDLYIRCIRKLSDAYAEAIRAKPGCRMAYDVAIAGAMPAWRYAARLFSQSLQGLFVDKEFTGALVDWYKTLTGAWAEADAAAKKGRLSEWVKAQKQN